MDPALQQKVTEILDYLLKTTKAGVDFASEQLPLVAWEQVAFARVWYPLVVVLCVAGIAVTASTRRWQWVRAWDKEHTDKEDRGIAISVYTVGMIIATAILGVALFIHLKIAVLAWFAPRVYLLQWAVELVKSTGVGK